MERRSQINLGYLIFALFAMLLLQQWWQTAQTVEVVPYSEFEKLLAEDRISEVTVSDQRITGKLRNPEKNGKTVAVANLVEPDLAARLSKYGVKYTKVHESTFLRDLLSWIVPALVFFGIWFWLIRRMGAQGGLGGGFMSIGKSRAKVYVEKQTGVTFADVAGLEKKNRILNERERRIVAHHELGHAMVAMALPGVDPVHKVSIIPRGVGALGYTIQRPTEDRFLMTREELENKMAVLLGGRAAEEVVFGHLSTGAADDLAKVTDIARSMVMRYGMVKGLGNVAYEEERSPFLSNQMFQKSREYSEETAREIDVAVRDIVKVAYDKALGILTKEKEVLERWARKLLEKETLVEVELADLRRSIGSAPQPAPA